MITPDFVRSSLNEVDARILHVIRRGLPLCRRPFRQIAESLEMDEEALLERLQELTRNRLLRYIGPLYFAEAYGRGLSLLTMSVDPKQLEAVNQTLGQFPEIRHHVLCKHRFNVWFTLAERGQAARERLRAMIVQKTGQRALHLHSQREFYPGDQARPDIDPAAAILSGFDWALIGATERGIPLVAEPWQAVATGLGRSTDELLARLQRLADWGILLRVAGVPDFCRLGLRAAGISVWDIREGGTGHVGALFAEHACVSQCSLRPRYEPDWPFNLMAIVHGRSRREVREQVARLAELAGPGCRGHDLLFRAQMIRKARDWPIQGVL